MENLRGEAEAVGLELQGSSQRLQFLTNAAHQSIGVGAFGIRETLISIDQKIQFISSQVQQFLRLIENGDSGSITLNPQMSWLSTTLSSVNDRFQTAAGQAESILLGTSKYVYDIMDLGQKVGGNKARLEKSQTDEQDLTRSVESKLRDSELEVSRLQSTIGSLEDNIRTKTNEITWLESQKKGLDLEINEKSSALTAAEKKLKKTRKKGGIAGAVTLIGVITTPVTAGVGMGVAAMAGEYITHAAGKLPELEARVERTRLEVQELEMKMSVAKGQLGPAVEAKNALQTLVTQYQLKVSDEEASQVDYNDQIGQLMSIRRDLIFLQERVESTDQTIMEVDGKLRDVKVHFDQCKGDLDLQASTLPEQSRFIDVVTRRRNQRAREYRRQMAIIQEVYLILGRIHDQLPDMLPSRDIRLIEFVPWEAGMQPNTELGEPIPPVTLR
ncbi:hypothetical protein B0O99DRAFT_696205 [Bisporella sp. PMI_857]|nr:hypothetical protein B0O99DRAFT_696205 [Bisporella sp. PMI_857]